MSISIKKAKWEVKIFYIEKKPEYFLKPINHHKNGY